MNFKDFVLHPAVAFLFSWLLPSGLFLFTLYFSLKQISILEKQNIALNAKRNAAAVHQIEPPKIEEPKKEPIYPLFKPRKKKSFPKATTIVAGGNFAAQKDSIKIIDSLYLNRLHLNNDTVVHFAGRLSDFDIINYILNNQPVTFEVSDCYLSININLGKKIVEGASLQVVYLDQTSPNSNYKADYIDPYDKYDATKLNFTDMSGSKDTLAAIEIALDNMKKDKEMVAGFKGYVTIDDKKNIFLYGNLSWNKDIPMYLQGRTITIAW
jgi:hypothetical protein